jgi:predicted small secreted protein
MNIPLLTIRKHWFEGSTAWLLRNWCSGPCAVWLGNCFPTFRKNVPPSSLGLWVNSRTRPWRWKRYVPSKHWEPITQSHGTASQQNLFLSMKTGLQLITSLSFVSFTLGKCAWLGCGKDISSVSSSLSFSLVTQAMRKYGCKAANYGGEYSASLASEQVRCTYLV